jgi:excisionase family DNA binding protein
MELLNTSEAAARLGISARRVLALIEEGKLIAQKVGRDYAIQESALEGVKVYGKAGRPPGKVSTANKAATAPANGSNAALKEAAKAKKKGKK